MPNNRQGLALLSNLYNVVFDSKFLTLASQLERCAGPSSHPFTSPCSSCPLLQNCQSLWDHSVAPHLPGHNHSLFTWTRVRLLQKQFSSFRKLKIALRFSSLNSLRDKSG